MIFLIIYINLIRAISIITSVYYIYKRQYIKIPSTAGVFVLTFLLVFLDKVFQIKIDILGCFLYITIIFMTVYLGNSFGFYDKFFLWDRLTHFLSGIAGVSFGIAVSIKFDNTNKFYLLLFSLTFSITLQTIWEVYEYTLDRFFNTNCQRWQEKGSSVNQVSNNPVQPAGLSDTMNDTIVCIIGAFASCIAWWYVL